ncbi:MAG: PIN domain-containing protein [Candidatus Obscuribacterales bacterium]|nr:PIN domain-containing protein [Candidatus Obscuribacterales bacterium]
MWYLLRSSRLSSTANAAFDDTLKSGDSIYLASISLVEVIYLVEKGKLNQVAADRLIDGIKDPKSNWILAPLDLAVSEELSKVPRDAVPDMPDRIIAATALHLELPLITVDSKLRSSGIKTIW